MYQETHPRNPIKVAAALACRSNKEDGSGDEQLAIAARTIRDLVYLARAFRKQSLDYHNGEVTDNRTLEVVSRFEWMIY